MVRTIEVDAVTASEKLSFYTPRRRPVPFLRANGYLSETLPLGELYVLLYRNQLNET